DLLFLTNTFSRGSTTYVAATAPLNPVLAIRASAIDLSSASPLRASKVELTWATLTNATYRLEFRSTLGATQWTQLQSVEGDGRIVQVYYAMSSEHRFYRIVVDN